MRQARRAGGGRYHIRPARGDGERAGRSGARDHRSGDNHVAAAAATTAAAAAAATPAATSGEAASPAPGSGNAPAPRRRLPPPRLPPRRMPARVRKQSAETTRSSGPSSWTKSRTTLTASGRREPRHHRPTTTRRGRPAIPRVRPAELRTSKATAAATRRGLRRPPMRVSSGWNSSTPRPFMPPECGCGNPTGRARFIKVEIFDEQGAAHTVWTGADSTKGLNFLIVEFPKTTYATNRVKLTLATNVVPGWSAIDAGAAGWNRSASAGAVSCPRGDRRGQPPRRGE
jgi:hypothetical protein